GCIVRHTLRRLLARGEPVGGVLDVGPWYDLGTIEDYARVNLGLLDGSIGYPGIEPPFEARWLDPLVKVAPGVTLGQRVVAGARAELRGSGLIERAVVWDGAVVDAPFANAVATSGGKRVAMGSESLPAPVR